MQRRILYLITVVWLIAFAGLVQAQASDDYQLSIDIDWPMYEEVPLEDPEVHNLLNPIFPVLWAKALEIEDVGLQIEAARTIAEAHRLGGEGLETCIDPLIKQLTKQDASLQMTRQFAATLVELDAKQAAEVLLKACSQGDRDVILVVDPALARWDYQAARAIWRQRVADTNAGRQIRSSAIRSLAAVGDDEAMGLIIKIAFDKTQDGTLRIVAAKAAGQSAGDDLIDDVSKLTGGSLIDRLVAVYCVANLSSREAAAVLYRLSQDSEPAVTTIAYERLSEIDPDQARSISGPLLKSSDATLRLLAAKALVSRQDTEVVGQIVDLINKESYSAIRKILGKALVEMGRVEPAATAVREAVGGALASDDESQWRVIEQAAYVAGKLDYEQQADRLVELMNFPRYEVRVAAIVALRWMAIERLVPRLYEQALLLTELTEGGVNNEKLLKSKPQRTMAGAGYEFAHLAQYLGQIKYLPADEMLRPYIEKNSKCTYVARASAIWALGHIHQGQAESQKELVELLVKRFGDNNDLYPESLDVRQMSGISLVNMDARDQLGVLRWHYNRHNDVKQVSCVGRWAVLKFTGEQLPGLKPIENQLSGWFLEPIQQQK